jgi:glycyl-tRNA synthetase beta chain
MMSKRTFPMIDFLLEIGFEEFPPHFLQPSAEALTLEIEKLLKDKQIFHRSLRTIYTPRRIGVIVLGLSRRQRAQIIEIQGPPKKFAYDTKGKPTDKLLGFMKANNLKHNEVVSKRTKKGDYVCGRKEIAGASTEDILHENIPSIIRSLEFPKTMIWNEDRVRFPRPIRWIVALLDKKPLRFSYGDVEANRYSWPNQHFSFKPIRLDKPREYMNFLRHGGVIVDPNERKKTILTRIKQAADKIEGKPVYNNEMIDEINCTTEYPEVVTGEFDSKYMSLPEEVLMSVLRVHGNVIWIKGTNKYIYVFSAKKKALQNVQKGYSRVMDSRLQDALFFYQHDMNTGLQKMLNQTKDMMWLENLGTLFDKATRLEKFAEDFRSVPGVDITVLKQAARLSKADLLSEMVREKEFTSLQGIMGGYYAQASGESEGVARAIAEHYLPRFIGDKLPKTIAGALLSIADKLDNVVGAFLSGNRPSSSYDPLAVRRNGYAVVNLLDARGLDISLSHAVDRMLLLYGKDFDANVVNEFFVERVARYLQDSGYRYDEVNAVLAHNGWVANVADTSKRCEALKGFRDSPEFVRLVIGQKRVRNIVKGVERRLSIDTELIKEPAEKALLQKGKQIGSKIQTMVAQKAYPDVLKLLLEMRPVIDKLFDDVLVMCEDKKLRENRLALVSYINELFLRFADFSQIVIEGEKASR